MTIALLTILSFFVLFLIFIISKHLTWVRDYEDVYNSRFVEVPTRIYLNDTERENNLTDDPILRKALGVRDRQSKEVTVRMLVDLEDISSVTEFTSSNYHDTNIKADCVLLIFKDGSESIAYGTYDEFMKIYTNYFRRKIETNDPPHKRTA
jgi:hypothetical protein